ncbi:MAG: AAA family ATPase [Balneolaceae bacterium]
MVQKNYPIKIEGEKNSGIPKVDENFGRVTVILGANGSGKTKLIESLKKKQNGFGGRRPLAYIEGGRVIKPPDTVSLNSNNFNQFKDLEKAELKHKSAKSSDLSSRNEKTLILLDRIGETEKAQHSDKVQLWIDNGKEGEPPSRSEPPLEKMFRMFQDIFPKIHLEINDKSKKITCKKNGSTYTPGKLSDGERQVLALLADIGILAEENSLILVDEPELNLNSHLACRVWDYIEANLPDAVFVYATHSLGFAMRRNVDQLLIIQGTENPALAISGLSQISPDELREFLGAVPAILAAPGAIVVEGHESSFDLIFYGWILKNEEYVIVPVGSCENVYSAVKRTGIWSALAPSVNITGLIDRDFRSDNKINELDCDECLVLELHEAESFLCDPDLLSDLSSKLGLVESPPSSHFFQKKILEFAEKHKNSIAAKRLFERASLKLNVSLPKQALSHYKDEKVLKNAVKKAAIEEAKKVEGKIGEVAVDRMLNEELIKINSAIKEKDLFKILNVIPGKELLNNLLQHTGCSSPSEVVRAASKHLNIENYKLLRNLSDKLNKLTEKEKQNISEQTKVLPD